MNLTSTVIERRARSAGPHRITPRTKRVLRRAKVRPAILLWALGVPIPLILLFLLLRGCMT